VVARTGPQAAAGRPPERPGRLAPPSPRRAAAARTERPVSDSVPRVLRVSAAVGWRLLVVAAALYVVGMAVATVASVVVPVAIALLLAALLTPAVRWLTGHGVPRGIATALMVVGGLGLVVGVLAFVVITFVGGAPQLLGQLSGSVDQIVGWLTTGPLRLSPQQLGELQQQVLTALEANQASITTSAVTTATTVGEIASEFAIVVFTLVFFLHGGDGIWQFLLGAVPERVRTRVDVAGRRGLAALVSYVRATAVVAAFDAVLIGIGLAVLRVPLAVSLAALVFLGAFVPIIGAFASGSVAVLVALVSQGPVTALAVLAVVIVVLNVEAHLLQPLLLGRAVRMHPLAVVLAVSAGFVLGGIAGALLAVPLLAVVNSGVRSLLSPADEHTDPEDVRTAEPEDSAPDEPDIDRHPELDLPLGRD
jgi:putative heme transporter